VDDILPLLQTSSVLAFPSHRETLGRVIFEAWDAGAIPVVFSGSGGAAEIVAAAKGGILYEEQTPESLARVLRDALELDQEQRAVLIGNGRSWMAENCNPEMYGEMLSEILGSVRGPKR
jgi:glycosyltransferase involved in cell wall biosynthesis